MDNEEGARDPLPAEKLLPLPLVLPVPEHLRLQAGDGNGDRLGNELADPRHVDHAGERERVGKEALPPPGLENAHFLVKTDPDPTAGDEDREVSRSDAFRVIAMSYRQKIFRKYPGSGIPTGFRASRFRV